LGFIGAERLAAGMKRIWTKIQQMWNTLW